MKKLLLLFGLLAVFTLGLLCFRGGSPSADHQASAADKVASPARSANPNGPYAVEVRACVDLMERWYASRDPLEQNAIAESMRSLVNPRNAGAIFRALPPERRETPFGLDSLASWASADRVAALRWLETQVDVTHFQIDAVLRGWAVTAREDMSAYLAALPAGNWRTLITSGLGDDALRNHDEETAFALALELPAGATQTRLLGQSVLLWARRDPAAAMASLDRVSDDGLQEQLIPQIAYGYAMERPDLAADWIQKTLPAGAKLNQCLGKILEIWVGNHEPRDAARWVQSLPEGQTKDYLVKDLIPGWKKDPSTNLERWGRSLDAGALDGLVN